MTTNNTNRKPEPENTSAPDDPSVPGLIKLRDLKTSISGVYITAECEDIPVPSKVSKLICNLTDGTQSVVCYHGESFIRSTNFSDYYGEWYPLEDYMRCIDRKTLSSMGFNTDTTYRATNRKTLPCIVLKSEGVLYIAYWNYNPVTYEEWMEAFCFSDGHSQAGFWWDEEEDQLPSDSEEAIEFVAKVQAYYDSLPGHQVCLVLKDDIHECDGWWRR